MKKRWFALFAVLSLTQVWAEQSKDAISEMIRQAKGSICLSSEYKARPKVGDLMIEIFDIQKETKGYKATIRAQERVVSKLTNTYEWLSLANGKRTAVFEDQTLRIKKWVYFTKEESRITVDFSQPMPHSRRSNLLNGAYTAPIAEELGTFQPRKEPNSGRLRCYNEGLK